MRRSGKKPRITIGTVEIGGSVAIYGREFRKLGYDVRTVVMFKNWAFSDETYDSVGLPITRHNFQYNLRREKPAAKLAMFARIGFFGLKELIRSLGRNNWFIFIYGSNFLPFHYSLPCFNFVDYALLKKLGNVIVSIFVGCDLRDRRTFSHFARKYDFHDVCEVCSRDRTSKCDPDRQRRVARGAERYSDIILSVPDISFLLTRPYYYFWVPIELDRYRFHIPRNPVPRIVHAPSERVLKGTALILKALDMLREEGYSFETVLLEKMSNEAVRETLSESDILVDQTYSNSTGKLALEGMASGCAVLCGLNQGFQGFPAECPAAEIKPDPDNIRLVLKGLLDHRERIYDLAARGRRYVEKYHDSGLVTRQLIRWIKDRPAEDLIQPRD